MPTTPAQPVLTVNQPTPNLVVGLNKAFQISGQVTDRGGVEPILIDSVTVQVDGGSLIHATLKRVANKTLTQVTFNASAQLTGGNDPHKVTIVATNDQNLKATKTVNVFAGTAFDVDTPALLLDILTLIPIPIDDPQFLALMGEIQGQLLPLSTGLASVGKILIGPNVISQPINSAESRIRVGLWIENSDFPVVPPSTAFPLPRLSDAAAAAAFAATPLLDVPHVELFPSFAVSIPVTTLQHLVDAETPSLKTEASKQGLTIHSVTVHTNSPNQVQTSVDGQLASVSIVPASFTVTETVDVIAVPDSPSGQLAPAVTATSSSSSVGSLLDWVIGVFVPLIGAGLAYAFHKVSVSASQQTGVAGSFLSGIPSRIPFGNKAFTLPATAPIQLPDFPTLNLYWNQFGATSAGLFGGGTTEIEPRTESIVKVSITGPDFFLGLPNDIIEKEDPTFGFTLENISPDHGNLSWQIPGAHPKSGTIPLSGPIAQAGTFTASFPLPAHIQPGVYPFTLNLSALETCESDSSKTLSGKASIAVKFQVKKSPTKGPGNS